MPVCFTCMAKCWLLYINVFPSTQPPQTEGSRASPVVSASRTVRTFKAPVTDQESTAHVELLCLCLQMLKEKSPDLDFVFKRKDNASRQRSKNPLTSPSGGRSTNPAFSGPYLLNTWSRGFSYHEIRFIIDMVENIKNISFVPMHAEFYIMCQLKAMM